jgi:hypothetical protein
LRKLLAGDAFESNLFESRTIIGIPRFEYAAGINLEQNIELGSQMMRFENMVYDHFDRGGFLIVGSSKPIAQLEGYRKNFLAHLKSVGQDVDLD